MSISYPCGRTLCQIVTICNNRGLHARASARFVRVAERFDAQINVEKDGVSVSANSIMSLMMLGAGKGSTILLRASGNEAREALEALVGLVEAGFDEDDEEEL